MTYTCEVCGKKYEIHKNWRSKKTCCPECQRIRKNANNLTYWRKKQLKINEERRILEIKKKMMQPKYTMAELNRMARERGMTYGQMQGYLYCNDHPMRHGNERNII